LIPVVIPSYEPDERFPALLQALNTAGIGPVVVVDDGSGVEYQSFFEKAQELIKESGGVVLHHEVNRGKGRGLKTAFQYILENYPDAIGCVTADSDGQHTPGCIASCIKALEGSPDSLILGVRDFTGEDIPFKSRFGNNLTIKVCSYLCGVKVSDTQTGLRGIPAKFMKELLDVPGERFEFEMRMLIESKDKYPIVEVPIETVYDSKENHQTHFDPIKDSIRIYSIFGKMFAKFIVSSLSSCVLDLLLFWIFCRIFEPVIGNAWYAAVATALARVISAVYNYTINYKFVFKSDKSHASSLPKYALLAVIQLCLSAGLVTFFVWLFPLCPELAIKIPVDVILFLMSYYIQRRFVY